MRAYNFMALLICISVGITLMFAVNLFNVSAGGYTISMDDLRFEIALWGIVGGVGGFVVATGVDAVLRGGGKTGVSYSVAVFGGIYWGIWGVVSSLLGSISASFEGWNYIWAFITLIAALIFMIAMVQMSSGGQKSHV